MSDTPRLPELDDLLDLAIEQTLDRVRGFEIGRVASYDEARQTVVVQPVVGRSRLGEDGRRQSALTSQLTQVPVWFFGAGGTRVTVPIQPGDFGIILFCSVSLSLWKLRGGVVPDPRDDRRHQESDTFFIPGGHPITKPPTPAPTDALVVHAGSRRIRLGSEIADEDSVRGNTYRTAEDSLHSAMTTAMTALSAAVVALAAASPTLTGTPPQIAAWTAAVTAVATAASALTAAASDFSSASSTYLQPKVKIL